MKKYNSCRVMTLTAIAIALVMVPHIALAHAVLIKSTPTANSTIQGTDIEIMLQFNSRVDGTRSTIQVADSNGQLKTLSVDKQATPDTLIAHISELRQGKYAIRWQVLAVDGHITRGQIPFEVK